MASEQEALAHRIVEDVMRLHTICDLKDARIAELEAERGAMEEQQDDRQALLEAELEAMEAERDRLQESLSDRGEPAIDLTKKLEVSEYREERNKW